MKTLKTLSIVFCAVIVSLLVIMTGCQTNTTTQENEYYTVTFVVDSHAKVTVYNTQDDIANDTNGETTTTAYSRNGDTGALTQTDGQVNFRVTCDAGYEVDSITVTDGTYKNLKELTNNGYRLTKISADTTVTITTTEVIEEVSSAVISTTSTITSAYNNSDLSLTLAPENDISYSYTVTNKGVLVITPKLADGVTDAEFTLSGSYNGGVEINASADVDVTINLSGATLYATKTTPTIYISQAKNCDISAKKETTNYVYDYRSSVSDLTAAIYSVCDLDLKGKGTLEVVSTYNNGIHTKDDLESKNLTLKVTCLDNALKGNDSVTIESGTYTLTASKGDAIKTSNGGLKSDGETRKGTVTISDGTLTLNALSDGIDSAYDVNISGGTITITTTGNLTNTSSSNYVGSAKGIKANNQVSISGGTISIVSTDDGIHADYGSYLDEDNSTTDNATGLGTIYISGGDITISSGDDGIHADNTLNINDGNINIVTSYEGLEANFLNISGGTISIYATNDGVNASKKIGQAPKITISGGYLDITVGNSDSDGVDSNGNYVQTGGIVITRGPSNSNENMASLDTDGSISITGGTLIALGAMGSVNTIGSSIYSVQLGSSSGIGMGGGFGGFGGRGGPNGSSASSSYSFTAGTYSLSLDTDTITFILSNTQTCLYIYSDQISLNSSYTLYKGATTIVSWSQTSKSVTKS